MPSPITRFSGPKLRDLRERAGLSRRTLAERCKDAGRSVSVQHVVRVEKGQSRPTAPLLKAFADALKVEIDALLDEDQAVSAATR